ncbi:BNR repeat-containing protein [Arthrobacter sp. NPDC090010]|uniref:BNR repeat-containing protein n=1 Tax=Arthrobacter sp. NPDC090010 TaxID=3363942 RepID=UPI003820734B
MANASEDHGGGVYDYLSLRVKQGPQGGWWQFLHVRNGAADEVPFASGSIPGVTGTETLRLGLDGGLDGEFKVQISRAGSSQNLVEKTVSVPLDRLTVGGRPGLASMRGTISADDFTVDSRGDSETDSFTAPRGLSPSKWTLKGTWTESAGTLRSQWETGGSPRTAELQSLHLGTDTVFSASVLPAASPYRRWHGVGLRPAGGGDSIILRVTPPASGYSSPSPAMWDLVRMTPGSEPQRITDAANMPLTGELANFDASRAVVLALRNHGDGLLELSVVQGGVPLLSRNVVPSGTLPKATPGGRGLLFSQGSDAAFDEIRIATDGTVFTDDFGRTAADAGAEGPDAALPEQELAGNWQEFRGDWAIRDGVAKVATTEEIYPGRGRGLLTALPGRWAGDADFRFSAKLRPSPGSRWSGIFLYGMSGTQKSWYEQYFAFQIAPGAGWRWIENREDGADSAAVMKEEPACEGGSACADPSFTVAADTSYELTVWRKAADPPRTIHFAVARDGTPVLPEQTVILKGSRPLEGATGLIAQSPDVAFDGVALTSPESSRPADPPVIRQIPDSANPARSTWTVDPVSNGRFLSSYTGSPATPTASTPPGGWRLPENNESMSPVPQALYTVKDASGQAQDQYIAYYNENRRLALAKRTMVGTAWGPFDHVEVDSAQLDHYDSHNNIALAVSGDGVIHLAGSMHATPMYYFASRLPGDIHSMTRTTPMVTGAPESQVTYPVFFEMAGALYFGYRSGVSGAGEWRYNRYVSGHWSPPQGPLFDSTGGSAYPANHGRPLLGPDGRWHMAWTWRSEMKAGANGFVSYAVSDDFVTWYGADGTKVAGPRADGTVDPLSVNDTAAIVDQSGSFNGVATGLVSIGFDRQKKPVLGYTRFDITDSAAREENFEAGPGSTQFFAARPRPGGGWQHVQLTNQYGRWAPVGPGTMVFPVDVGSTSADAPAGLLAMPYSYGWKSGTFLLDESTLEVRNEASTTAKYGGFTRRPGEPAAAPSGMAWQITEDGSDFRVASGTDTGARYVMRYATFPTASCKADAAGNTDSDNTGPCDPTGEWIPKAQQAQLRQPMDVYLVK